MNNSYITRKSLVLEVLSFVLMLGNLALVLVGILTAKGPVPMRYNAAGEAISYGSPMVLLILPGMILSANILLSLIVHRLPAEYWNMPFAIRQGKEQIVFSDMVMMLVGLELEFAVFSLVVSAFWIQGKGIVIAPASMVLLAAVSATIVLTIWIAGRHNKQK